MRVQPGMTVIAAGRPPASSPRRCAPPGTCPGPVYYRLGKDDTTTVPGLDGRFALGRAERVRDGRRRAARRARAASRPRPRAAADAARRARRPRAACSSSRASSPRRSTTWPRRSRACRSRVTVEAHYVDRRPRLARRRGRSPSAGLGCRLVRCARARRAGRPSPAASAACTERHGLVARGARATALGALRRRACDERRALVSIVLPVHNQADHIAPIVRGVPSPRSAAAAACRTRSCSCRTPAATTRATICRTLAASDPRVRVVDERARRLGPRGAARARARRAATCSATPTRRAPRRRSCSLLLLYALRLPRRRREGEPQDPRALDAGGSARCSTTSSAARSSTSPTGTSTARRRSSRAASTGCSRSRATTT